MKKVCVITGGQWHGACGCEIFVNSQNCSVNRKGDEIERD